MPVASPSSRISLAVLTAAATWAPGLPPVAVAAPPDARAATPEACSRLGYDISTDSQRDHRRRMRAPGHAPGMGGYMAAPLAPPAPAPSTSLQQSVVTGRRIPEPPSIPPLPVPPVAHRFAPPGVTFPGPPAGTIETERYPHAGDNPVKRVAEEPVSTFSIDVDTAAYANVRRFLNDGTRPPKDAVRVEEMINYFDYGYERPRDRSRPFSTYVSVVPSPWSADRRILQIGLQGYELPRASQPPLNLVFLIDTSGSMSSEDRLPLAKKALNLLIDQLGPADRVAMVAYAGSAGAVLAPTGGREKLKMRCALEALGAGGSTAGGQGLALAYALAQQNYYPKAVNRVILMTDGDFNVGVADPAKLKDFVAEKRKTGVYLSVYGFGRGNYNDAMMQTLAQNGNGTAGYIDTLSEGRKAFRKDFAGSLFPIADDVKVQVEFNPAAVAEYRLIGYETRLLNREDFNNDKVDAGEVGSGASVTALYELTPTGARPSSDPLRYGARAARTPPGGREIAYLKIRYKLPGESASRLIERPITPDDAFGSLAQAPEPTRWATAVAGFGQRLRGDPWLDDRFGWREIGALAQGARGEDPFGLRAEFVQLVRAAGDARSVNE
jgi:Ca-activated chloride channel family protein